jgi:prevent-host-death family protein
MDVRSRTISRMAEKIVGDEVSAADLRKLQAEVLNRAVRGKVTFVTSRGRRVAAVVPVGEGEAIAAKVVPSAS